MMIFSAASVMNFLFVILSFAVASKAKKDDLNYRDISSLTVPESVMDLLSLESTEQEKVVNPPDDSKQDLVSEASRRSVIVKNDQTHRKNSPKYSVKLHNVTDDSYDVIQWYSTPIKKSEDDKLDSSIDSHSKIINNKRDLKAQSSYNYDEAHHHHYDVEHSTEDDHNPTYHHDDQPHDHHKSYNSEEDNNSGEPRSSVYYKKIQTKKPRRNCSRSKGKKAESWPEKSDTIIHSRTNRAHRMPHYDSKDDMSTEGRFYDIPKITSFSEGRINSIPEISEFSKERYNLPKTSNFLHHSPMGFSGEHLHGIPRTHFFSYKNGEGGNHFHLHNHHHHYGPDGKKIGDMQSYKHMIENLGKLKSFVSEKDSVPPNSYSSHTGFHSTDQDITKPKLETGKRGYHYTGPHESYGRKTYYRIKDDSPNASPPEPYSNPQSYDTPESYNNPQSYNAPESYNNPQSYNRPQSFNNPESYSGEKSIGMEMYRYGAGQYGTDEFHDGPYPNEVSPGIHSHESNGERFTPEHENRNPPYSSHEEHNSDLPPRAPYEPYSGEYEPNYNPEGKGHKHDQKHETKAPYTPYEAAKGTRHGNHQNQDHTPEHVRPYQGHLNHEEEKNGGAIPQGSPPEHSAGEGPPSGEITTHSVSYSKDGKLAQDPSFFEPQNNHHFNNLRPDPDPLSIPKNARIFEHHIRLHPMHYSMFPPLPIQGAFGRTIAYPVPVHKLIPNPLKMPHSFVPPAPMYPHPRLNQMLHAYQSRSLYHRWW